MATPVSASPSATFTPALKPPPGVLSNPDHPASLAHHADIAMAVALPLATIFFLLRMYVRAILKRVFILEDALVILGWAGTVAFFGIMKSCMVHHGGRHGWDLDAHDFRQAAFWFNVGAIEYGVVIAVTKVAILCLYRRVFSTVRRSKFDITILGLIALMVGFYTITTFFKIFECNPRQRIWNKSVPGKCVQISWILNVSGVFNTVTDYILLLLPVHAVYKLQMGRFKKVLVVLAFTFGLCAPVFATVGLVVRLKGSGSPDKSWQQPEILIWAGAELTCGNLCVCFPELTPLLRMTFGGLSTRPRRSTDPEVLQRGSSRARRHPGDPYLPKSLMTTTISTTDQYIELNDR